MSEWPVAPPRPEDKSKATVAIVGKGGLHTQTPFGRRGYEFWGLNMVLPLPNWAPVTSYHRWFQLHSPAYMAVHYPPGVEELDLLWAKEHGDLELYMDRHYPEYPNSVAFPADDMRDGFWGYHTSSIDWMVALAIHEGFGSIELYGCDFKTFPLELHGEPAAGRPCLEYWLGYAQGKGINVSCYTHGDMFLNVHVAVYKSTLRYGLDREPALDLGLEDEEDRDGFWYDIR